MSWVGEEKSDDKIRHSESSQVKHWLQVPGAPSPIEMLRAAGYTISHPSIAGFREPPRPSDLDPERELLEFRIHMSSSGVPCDFVVTQAIAIPPNDQADL